MKALANSLASLVQNWTQLKSTNSPKKSALELITISTATSARDGVQSTIGSAHAITTLAWVIRPSRRSVKRSAQTWTSRGTGLVSIWSRRPVRMNSPMRSTLPMRVSAMPMPTPVAP